MEAENQSKIYVKSIRNQAIILWQFIWYPELLVDWTWCFIWYRLVTGVTPGTPHRGLTGWGRFLDRRSRIGQCVGGRGRVAGRLGTIFTKHPGLKICIYRVECALSHGAIERAVGARKYAL